MKQFIRGFVLSLLLMIVMSAGNAQTFTNPILGGDFPDPSIVRDGEDYYMTHSAFDYQPGLTVWHSRDLVNWEPISAALNTYLGSVWAPDICKYGDKYFIYFTVAVNPRTNYVVWADTPYGPWSEPIDLKIGNIDPCHVVGEDGSRWLFMSGGRRARLADDGLSIVPGTEEQIYKGWQYPKEWITEGMSLEGPKLRKIGDYYYYLNAEGGTAGPATSHMVVMARSKSVNGPWENSPYNPIIYNYKKENHWWSRGHGTLIDTPDGKWYCVYHAYENSFTDLGRQTLLEPLKMTNDGWFRPVIADKNGLSADPVKPIKAPLPFVATAGRYDRLNEFRLGLEWKFYRESEPERLSVKDGVLTMQAKGKTPGESFPLLFVSGEHRYSIEAEIELSDPQTKAGLVLYYDSVFFMGTGFDANTRLRYRKGTQKGGARHANPGVQHMWLKLINDGHTVLGQYSYDGVNWERETWAMDCSGYNHNTLYQFQSVLPGLFVCGKGSATFKNFKYRNLDKEEVLASMKKATQFMMDSISYNGAFVWNYLPDMSRMWGELEAPKRTMVWIQPPGTPSMGHILLDAYHATGDEYYYEQALKVAKVLASVQHKEGGWNYVEDLAGEESLKEFYSTIGRQAWRLEEFQHYYGNCTFDDEATAVCAKLMLRVYLEKKDPVIKKSLDKVINFVVKSQYSNGGWPQRFPLMYNHPFRGKEDYSSFVTLNDDVMPDNIEFLTMCCQELGRKDLLKPIDKAMKLAIRLQQPAPLAGWADQYFVKTLKPAHARSYEPRSVNTGTTVRMIRAMFDYYRMTGDASYLDVVPAALQFLEEQRLPDDVVARWERKRKDAGDAFLVARFLNPEDGAPQYVHRAGSNIGTGHYFTTSEISGTIAHYSSAYYVNPKSLRKEYEALRKMPLDKATAQSPLLFPEKNHALSRYYYGAQGGTSLADVQEIMSEQKANGSWITPLYQMSNPYLPLPEGLTESDDTTYSQTMVGDKYDTSPFTQSEPSPCISTKNYIKVMSQMIHWMEGK